MIRKALMLSAALGAAMALSSAAPPLASQGLPIARLIVPLSFIPDEAAVVNKFDADLEKRFAFARTIGQILSSAGIANTAATREAFVQTMLASFNANIQVNPVSSLATPVDVRANEAGLGAAALLDPAAPNGLVPIGLFNRLDLAPADWSDCGEHRIVYATKPGAPGARFFVIFEAKLPNPQPAKGIAGCRPVAARWVSAARTPASRNDLLDKFYYSGLTGFRPVVDFLNYGSFLGQVRVNAFVGSTKWQLREFRVLPVAASTLAFAAAPVGSNPITEFYANGPGAGGLQQSERALFQTAFGALYVPNLRLNDATRPATTSDADYKELLFNTMGAGFVFRSDDFQSDAQGSSDNPSAVAGTQIKAQVPDNWASPIGTRTISEAQMLNRAGAVTCGGCHQFSNGQPIGTLNGQPLAWPASAGFVHISESSDANGHVLSPALRDFFIPFRRKVTRTVYNRPLQIQGRLQLDLIPGNAKLRTFSAPVIQRAARVRSEAETLARRVVNASPPASPLLRNQLRLAQPLTLAPQATELRRVSDQAHADELEAPGFFLEVRRPH